jgi:hypothetical protein
VLENYWITSVKADTIEATLLKVQRFLGEKSIFAVGERTPGRTIIKRGDSVCFYASRIGIVGDGTLETNPERIIDRQLFGTDNPFWMFRVSSVSLYLSAPIVFESELINHLEAFRGKKQTTNWSWFVQATRKISKHDFQLLTRNGIRN